MDWKEIGPYREAMIWVRALPNGTWMAAVVPLPSPTAGRPAPGGPPGDWILPEAFASDTAAVAAAMRHINREQERRVLSRGGPKGAGPEVSPEHRRFLRFPVALPVIALLPQGMPHELHGTVRNVGAGGMMAEFPLPLVPGRTVELRLHTRRGLVTVAARIDWTAPANGTVRHGCAFPEPKEESFAVGLFVGGSA